MSVLRDLAGVLKDVARRWLPPAVKQYLGRRIYGAIEYTGPYRTWEEARRLSNGYDADIILQRTLAGALMVKRGQAAYERDSLTFPVAEPPLTFLTALLFAAALEDGTLTIVDLGGSLASLYFRCKPFLSHLGPTHWCIVEQPRVVDAGKMHFEEDGLSFCYSLDEAAERHGKPTIICASSVLNYVGAVEEVCANICKLNPRVIFVDRTVMSDDDADHILVQNVPASVYLASYPSKFLSWSKLRSHFEESYLLVADFPGSEGRVSGSPVSGEYRAAIWLRKS